MNEKIYEAQGIDQNSDHPMGAVQNTVYSQIRFLWTGLFLTGIAVLGLWMLYFNDADLGISRSPFNLTVWTILIIGVICCAFQMFYFTSFRIKLRRSGFELCNIFSKKVFLYKNVQFQVDQAIEYRRRAGNVGKISSQQIFICRILLGEQEKPILLKSSRYRRLQSKMEDCMGSLAYNK